MESQHDGAITTSESNADGRLKVSVGRLGDKRRCLKDLVQRSKNDGLGGPGIPGYGMTKKQTSFPKPTKAFLNKSYKSPKGWGSLKKKKMKTLSSMVKSLGKQSSFKKSLGIKKPKNFRNLLKSIY
jgi:hypothetical protein